MDLIRTLRRGEYAAYLIVLGLTAILLGLSVYLAGYRLYELATTAASNPPALTQAIYNALSDVFLVVIFVELIDTFVTYLEKKRLIVYRIIDVALVALARELFIYMAPVNTEFTLEKGIALILATAVIGFVDYLQRRGITLGRMRR